MILYEGDSLLDGQPIVAIAIKKSSNEKTGNMVQTYILRQDVSPMLANKLGLDASICGECIHRGTPSVDDKRSTAENRTCYVTLAHGPNNVYKAYRKGKYSHAKRGDMVELGKNRFIRLGTYGDPAAVPSRVWDTLLKYSSGHTGYSHQWETHPEIVGLIPDLIMASADSLRQARKAWSQDYRTFRTLPVWEYAAGVNMPEANEIFCPESFEGGASSTCKDCLLCSGNTKKAKNIVIVAHGAARMGVQ